MNDLSEFVVLSDTTLTTDSRRVAKHFKKQHHHVVQKIESLTCSAKFLSSNFSRVDYVHKGNTYVGYEMTKDGFVMLAMSFTGAAAMKVKEKYILAFNAMAEQLQRIGNSLWAQRLDLEKREATSFMWASFGAKRMQERRYAKPRLENERAIIDSEMQPTLFQGGGLPFVGMQ